MGSWTRRRLLLSGAASAASAAGLATTATAPATAAGPARTSKVTGSGRDDVVEGLRTLPGLRIIEERQGAEEGYRFFVLSLRQPVDHRNWAAGTFEQRLILLHTSADRPTVLF